MTVEEQQLEVLQKIHDVLVTALPHLFNLIAVSLAVLACLIGFNIGVKR